MNQIYYCKLCEQKYMENEEVNSKRIYTTRVADLDKTKPIHKNCRVCSKLFDNKYGYIEY